MESKPGQDKEIRGGVSGSPLLDAVDRYLVAAGGSAPLRLHVPGHKGGPGAPPQLLARWGSGVFADDLTELPGLDDLAAPLGAIARSQAASALRLAAGAAYYLVQGTTGGLVALALAAARASGGAGRVLVPRHAHRAFVASMVLAGLDPVFIPMRFFGGLPCGPDVRYLRMMLDAEDCAKDRAKGCGETPPIIAMFDTYPNIHGVAHDLAEISATCRRRRLPLFVDGAHAGLFGLDPLLPASPLSLGADAVVISAHKTMGSLGQSSLLLLSAPAITGSRPGSYPSELGPALRLVQTTSPSYPLLLSLEAAVQYVTCAAGRKSVREAAQSGITARAGLERLGVGCWEPGEGDLLVFDPMRLTIDTIRLGRDGFTAAEALRRAGVQVEGADWRSVLVVFGPGDGPLESRRLVEAVAALLDGRGMGAAPPEEDVTIPGPLTGLFEGVMATFPVRALSPREAWFRGGHQVPLREAAGLVATEPLAPYPPGVPVVWPGEVLSAQVVELLTEVVRLGGAVHGLEPGAGPESEPGEAMVRVLGRSGG